MIGVFYVNWSTVGLIGDCSVVWVGVVDVIGFPFALSCFLYYSWCVYCKVDYSIITCSFTCSYCCCSIGHFVICFSS
jgi:hypothetical protein